MSYYLDYLDEKPIFFDETKTVELLPMEFIL
jgi:hypothetical protein